MSIHDFLKKKPKKKKKILGRGYGSNKGGHTVGRGAKGQKARSKVSLGFEGGQVPLFRKVPELGGFRHPNSKKIATVNLSQFNIFNDGEEISPKNLEEKGLLPKGKRHGVKVLAKGNLEKKLVLNGFMFSKSALELVEKAGSKVN